MHLITVLLFLAVSGNMSAEEERILNFDALHSEAGLRRSVEEKFPNLSFGFYHWTGNWIIGALKDFDHDRILIVIPFEGNGGGEVQLDRNGERLKLPPGEPATLRVAGVTHTPEGRVSNPEIAEDQRIGYWVQLKATDRLRIFVKLTDPAKGEFLGTYDPDNGWQTSCAFEEPDKRRKDPADVYEISRSPLVPQIRNVLETKQDCIVRLKSRMDLVMRKWPPAEELAIEPLWLTLTDKITYGAVEFRNEQSPQELVGALELYCEACRITGSQSHVQLIVSDKTDDKIFRATLKVLTDAGFGAVYFDDADKETGEKMPKPAQPDGDEPSE